MNSLSHQCWEYQENGPIKIAKPKYAFILATLPAAKSVNGSECIVMRMGEYLFLYGEIKNKQSTVVTTTTTTETIHHH